MPKLRVPNQNCRGIAMVFGRPIASIVVSVRTYPSTSEMLDPQFGFSVCIGVTFCDCASSVVAL
jgi:hypothetical protein